MNLDLGDTRAIIQECLKHKLSLKQAAYVLATSYLETNAQMKPVIEAYWLSESWRKRNLRYYPHYGRGYVQLTWDYNYKKASDKLGHDFIKDPDALLEPHYAAAILVIGMKEGWFTGHKLSDHINETKTDYFNARRIVNAMDKAFEFKTIAIQYEKALEGNYKRAGFLELLLEFFKGWKR